MKQVSVPCMWHLSNCFWPYLSSRHLTFGISGGPLGHDTTQNSLSFNWLQCFRWWASCQQKQILLILTKLANTRGNGRSHFFWWLPQWSLIKSASTKPPKTSPLPLCMSRNTHHITIAPSTWQKQQPLSSSGVCEISHSFFTTRPSSRPPPAYEILPFLAASSKRWSQSSTSDGSYNFPWTMWSLKRKIAFNISSIWKTTVKRYNCNAAASVGTWLGQRRYQCTTGGWGAYKSAL